MNGLCSHERLELALAGTLNADEELTLHRHLDVCESCATEMERLAGGEEASQEIAELLVHDELDNALPLREECSTADFVVDHLEPSDDPAVLGRLGGYDVHEIIGRGGMGVVLKGFDRELKRFVAIKALAPHLAHSALARKRFAREAQAAAAVVNLHVVAIHQVQPNGQLPFLVMPLLAGESLAHRIKTRGTLELNEILRIGMQAAEGLAAAHGQGLIHRDVKPANILLEEGVERAVLTDFGLARAADDVSMTRQGVVAGTPEYMSPEQARGEALDGRSDLFSLGCVLYEMATGVSPFRTDSTMATLRRIVDEQPAAMASLAPELPPWFCHIVERLLSKDPTQRFGSASEVSQLLEECLSHLQQPTSVPLPASLVPHVKSRRSMFNSFRKGVIAVLGTIGLTLIGMVLMQATDTPKNKAEELFRQMERACVQAKSANVTFSGEFQGEFDGELKGSLLLAAGNKSRREFTGDLAFGEGPKQPFNVVVICDGKQSTAISAAPKAPSQVVDVPEGHSSKERLVFARAGVLGPMFLLVEKVQPGRKPREFDAEKDLGVTDFQLGESQIIGEQQALTIHHKLHNRNCTEPLAVTVWLDAKTKLPLKREITVNQNQEEITLTETYPTLTLDEKVDDQRFELPKQENNPLPDTKVSPERE